MENNRPKYPIRTVFSTHCSRQPNKRAWPRACSASTLTHAHTQTCETSERRVCDGQNAEIWTFWFSWRVPNVAEWQRRRNGSSDDDDENLSSINKTPSRNVCECFWFSLISVSAENDSVYEHDRFSNCVFTIVLSKYYYLPGTEHKTIFAAIFFFLCALQISLGNFRNSETQIRNI